MDHHDTQLRAFTRWCAVVVFLFLTLGCDLRYNPSQPGAGSAFTVRIQPVDGDPAVVEVRATASDGTAWSELERVGISFRDVLKIHLVDDAGSTALEVTPLLGAYELQGKDLVFRPALPLVAGHRYRALLSLVGRGGATGLITHDYTVSRSTTAPPPRIVAIHPSTSLLPANHLKFYVLFSEPMRQGGIFQYFRLRNLTRGEDVPRPFRHTELWDGDRLTLWFHPGRQKTGVNLNVEIGAILRAGDEYEFVVSGQWPSLRGSPLGVNVTKRFRAGAPDHESPTPASWIAEPPRAGTSTPMLCRFPEPLDWALLHSEVRVEDAEGKRVAGEVELRKDGTVWAFLPRDTWQAGRYRLAVGSVLEDLAGNSIARPFEVDLNKKPVPSVAETVYIEFEIVLAGGAQP